MTDFRPRDRRGAITCMWVDTCRGWVGCCELWQLDGDVLACVVLDWVRDCSVGSTGKVCGVGLMSMMEGGMRGVCLEGLFWGAYWVVL